MGKSVKSVRIAMQSTQINSGTRINRPSIKFMLLATLIFFSGIVVNAQDITITRIATNLNNPRGIAVLPDGQLIVVEAGTGFEPDGQISLLDDLNDDGDYDDESEITVIQSGYPSYNSLTKFFTGHDEVFGLGDILLIDDTQIFFTKDDPFAEPGHAGEEGFYGDTGIFNFQLDSSEVIKIAHSEATVNSIVYDPTTETFYMAESGRNRLGATTIEGEDRIVTYLPFMEHDQQPVPSGLAIDPLTGDILIALFTGFNHDYYEVDLGFQPFDAKIVRVDPETGDIDDVITGLTTAIDVDVDHKGNIFVVELTTGWPTAFIPKDFPLDDPNAPPDSGGYQRFSGRVTMHTVQGERVILADNLDTPTNVTYADGAVYISTGLGTPGRSIIGNDGITPIVGEIFKIILPTFD